MNATTPATQTLADFLSARLDEDEAAARAELALRGSGTRHPIGHPCDPARVLAEVAAKRAVLNMNEDDQHSDAYVTAIRALASVYSEHPDYREEWRP